MATSRPTKLYIGSKHVANMTKATLSMASGDKTIETSGGTVLTEGKDTNSLTFNTIETVENTGISANDILDIMRNKKVVTIIQLPINAKSWTTTYKCNSIELVSDVAGGSLEGTFVFAAVEPQVTVA